MFSNNGFIEKFKNLARYRAENNFVWAIKMIYGLTARMLKLFAALSLTFKCSNYFNV